MDIMRMHDMIEKLSESAECEFAKGIECVDTEEMGKVTDMLKDLAEAMYYRTLTKSMDEAEPEQVLDMFERYGDGRFAPKGRGTRRGYDEPPYWHMTPEMYREMEQDRDMDRHSGRMYYTEPKMASDGGMRDRREGKSGMSRRSYMESKELHKGNTPEDKDAKMHDLERYMKELSEDMAELISDMTPEERTMTKSKLSTLVSKM